MKLRYTQRAKNDLTLAFEWYEKQRRGLGFEFVDCIEIAIKGILAFPEMYQFYIQIPVKLTSMQFTIVVALTSFSA